MNSILKEIHKAQEYNTELQAMIKKFDCGNRNVWACLNGIEECLVKIYNKTIKIKQDLEESIDEVESKTNKRK